MTAGQPRRTRRRSTPAAALPRPAAGAGITEEPAEPEAIHAETHRATRRTPPRAREHHVTNTYAYVKRDLLTVAGVGVVVIAFIVGMSYRI
jgi:hypothetical protein